MKKKIIAAAGEILWDVLPSGKVIGGAPFNFINHVSRLGYKGICLSAIGNDKNGAEILRYFKSKNLDLSGMQIIPKAATGTVDVKLENGTPEYEIHENRAWDMIAGKKAHNDLIKNASLFYFGTIAQRNKLSRITIYHLLETAGNKKKIFFDANLRQNFYNKKILEYSLNKSGLVKINDYELDILTDFFNLQGRERQKIEKLFTCFKLIMIALTKGQKGSVLFNGTEYSELPARKIRIVDTIGAGDAFSAAFACGYLENKSIAEIHSRASELASRVCRHKGAIL